jgi:hypothetical protein
MTHGAHELKALLVFLPLLQRNKGNNNNNNNNNNNECLHHCDAAVKWKPRLRDTCSHALLLFVFNKPQARAGKIEILFLKLVVHNPSTSLSSMVEMHSRRTPEKMDTDIVPSIAAMNGHFIKHSPTWFLPSNLILCEEHDIETDRHLGE